MNKYGFENFEFEILWVCYSKEELDFMEIQLILLYDSKKYGYNTQNGGNSVGKFSEETKKKMSENTKGKHISPKTEFDGTMCGEKHPESKLTLNDVNLIREEYKTTNISQRKLAKKYNVSQRQIYRIVNNKSWVIDNEIEFNEGVSHSNKKLNEDKINEIIIEYSKGGISQLKLAKKYKVSQKTIWRIVNGK